MKRRNFLSAGAASFAAFVFGRRANAVKADVRGAVFRITNRFVYRDDVDESFFENLGEIVTNGRRDGPYNNLVIATFQGQECIFIVDDLTPVNAEARELRRKLDEARLRVPSETLRSSAKQRAESMRNFRLMLGRTKFVPYAPHDASTKDLRNPVLKDDGEHYHERLLAGLCPICAVRYGRDRKDLSGLRAVRGAPGLWRHPTWELLGPCGHRVRVRPMTDQEFLANYEGPVRDIDRG